MPTVRQPARGHSRRLPPDEVIDRFVELVGAGNYLKSAAAGAGLRERGVHEWLREGATGQGRPWCQDFHRRVTVARAEAQIRALGQINKAASSGTWQAAAWFLERSDPTHWGGRHDHRHQVEAAVTPLPFDARTKLEDVLSRIRPVLEAHPIDTTRGSR